MATVWHCSITFLTSSAWFCKCWNSFSTGFVYLFMFWVWMYAMSLNVCYHLETGTKAKKPQTALLKTLARAFQITSRLTDLLNTQLLNTVKHMEPEEWWTLEEILKVLQGYWNESAFPTLFSKLCTLGSDKYYWLCLTSEDYWLYLGCTFTFPKATVSSLSFQQTFLFHFSTKINREP